MATTQLSNDALERLGACTNAQDALTVLSEEGYELTDTQLDAIAGGAAAEWSLEQLIESIGDAFAVLFPEGFDANALWGNLPSFAGH